MAATTTRERLEAAAADLQAFVASVDETGQDFSAEQMAIVTEKTQNVVALKAQHAALGGATDIVREIGSMSEAGEAVRNISDVEQTPDGRRANPNGMTFGQLFTESPEMKGFLDRHARNGIIPSSAKGLNSGTFQSGLNIKNLITGASSTSGGALIEEDRQGGIDDLAAFRERSILDVITKGSTDSDTVEYVQVTSKTNNAAPVAEATSSADPTQDGTTGALILNAGGGYKPESNMALQVVSTAVKTIAHWLPVTKRAASDAGQIMTLINSFLIDGLFTTLEDQIIAGDGTGENFDGLENNADVLTVGSAGTDLDAVVDAIRTVRTGATKSRPTALAIHPNDWYSSGFLTAKDSQGNYLIGDPRASIDDLQSLWGLQVVVSEGVTENQAIVGDFRQAILWENEGVQVTMTDSHADFFVRNLLAILAETRAAFGIRQPTAFCKITAI